MQTAKLLEFMTAEDYLEGEKTSQVKHEYSHGRVFAMAGASDRHNRIAGNVFAQLWQKAGSCTVYMSDMKVKVSDAVFYYPDVMVVCREDSGDYFKTEPCLIVEVLSRSTATTDKREKQKAYLDMPSLQSYILIDSESQSIISYERTQEGWLERTYGTKDNVSFSCLETSLDVEAIYRGIEFPPTSKQLSK